LERRRSLQRTLGKKKDLNLSQQKNNGNQSGEQVWLAEKMRCSPRKGGVIPSLQLGLFVMGRREGETSLAEESSWRSYYEAMKALGEIDFPLEKRRGSLWHRHRLPPNVKLSLRGRRAMRVCGFCTRRRVKKGVGTGYRGRRPIRDTLGG